MDPNDLMAAIAQAGGGGMGGGMMGGMMPPDPGMQEAGGPPDPMAALMGGGGGESDLMSLFAQQPGGQGSAPAAGGGGAAAAAPEPAPTPTPTPAPPADPAMVEFYKGLTDGGMFDAATGTITPGLGTTAAINKAINAAGGLAAAPPWMLDALKAAKSGTPISSGLMDSLKGAYTTSATGRKVTKGSQTTGAVVPK